MKSVFQTIILFSFTIAGILAGCSKDAASYHDPTINSAPVINAIIPTHGGVGTTVTISGSGFNLSTAEDSVFFNGKRTAVVSSSSTQLVVTVPGLAGTGNVSIRMNGTAATGPVFTYDTSYMVSTFVIGLSNPQYITIGGGNLYVTNYGNGTISKISASGVVSLFASGFKGLRGITMDTNGSLYVVDNDNTNKTKIFKVNATGVASLFASITGYIYGISIDNLGNLYAANTQYGTISKITTAGLVSTIADGLISVSGVAVSASGNIYATGISNGTVYKINKAGELSILSSGFSFGGANGIAVDRGENLYVTIFGNNTLSQYNTVTKIISTGVASIFTGGFDHPCGITMDGSGNFYVVNTFTGNSTSGSISKISAW